MGVRHGVWLLFAVGCEANLTVDAHDKISCATSKECPQGFSCEQELGACIPSGADAARQAVTFTLPHDGDSNVSTTGQIVVALALPVDLASAATRAHLTSASGDAVALNPPTSPEANTLIITAAAELSSLTEYTLVLDPGITADSAALALPSNAATTIHFTSAERRKTTPPGPVSAILIDHVSAARADLSWINPPDSDWAGVLILRKFGAPLVLDATAANPDLPTSGVSYAVGAQIGAAQVAGVIASDHLSLVDLQAGFYDWAFFAMDTSTNYSAPKHVPFVSATAVTWCPSESGAYGATSTDAGTQALLLTPSGGTETRLATTALGTSVTLAPPDVSIGASYSLRFSAMGDDGEYRSVPQTFVASDASLLPLAQPTGVAAPKIGLGGTAVFGFNAYAWPAFEAAVDTDPAPEPETEIWAPISATLNGAASYASAPMTNAGAFKLRVRPVVAGCGDAAWVESNEFTVGGGARYVSQALGNDSNDGTSRVSAFKSIEKAIALANGTDTLDIYVSEGTYAPTAIPCPATNTATSGGPNNGDKCAADMGGAPPYYTQGLVLPGNTRLFGGYSDDFLARDLPVVDATQHSVARQYETIIQGDLYTEDYEHTGGGYDSQDCHTAVTFTYGSGGNLLDGVTIEMVGAEATSHCGIYIGRYVGATINNCHIRSSHPSTGTPWAVAMRCGQPVTLSNNWIDPNGENSNEVGVYTPCGTFGTPVTITGNLITSVQGLIISENNDAPSLPVQPLFLIDHNRIIGDPSPSAVIGGGAVGVSCGGATRLQFTHNFVQPTFPAYQGVGTLAFLSGDHCFGTVSDNTIDGGVNSSASVAMQIGGVVPLPQPSEPMNTFVFSNNIISAGLGSGQRTALVWSGSNPDASSSAELIFAHNDFLAYSGVAGQLGRNSTELVNAGGAQYLPRVGRMVNNLFFGLWTNQQGLLYSHGDFGAFQNNLFVLDPKLSLYDNNGSDFYTLSDFQTEICGDNEMIFSAGNAATSLPVSSLFKNFAGDAAAYANIEAADFTPITAAVSVGLDTTLAICGGTQNGTANACELTPTSSQGTDWCGNVTVDKAGAARPSVPAAGAYEPAPPTP
jgi:hypothetical protein